MGGFLPGRGPFLVVGGGTVTIVALALIALSKFITQGDLVEAPVVKPDVPGLIGIVIGDQKTVHIGPDDGGEEVQPLFPDPAIGQVLRPVKAPAVGKAAP